MCINQPLRTTIFFYTLLEISSSEKADSFRSSLTKETEDWGPTLIVTKASIINGLQLVCLTREATQPQNQDGKASLHRGRGGGIPDVAFTILYRLVFHFTV